jgi:hypothetical protein
MFCTFLFRLRDCPLLFSLSNALAHVYSQSYCRFSPSGGCCHYLAVDWLISFPAGVEFPETPPCVHTVVSYPTDFLSPKVRIQQFRNFMKRLVVHSNVPLHCCNTILYMTFCTADIATFFFPQLYALCPLYPANMAISPQNCFAIKTNLYVCSISYGHPVWVCV